MTKPKSTMTMAERIQHRLLMEMLLQLPDRSRYNEHIAACDECRRKGMRAR